MSLLSGSTGGLVNDLNYNSGTLGLGKHSAAFMYHIFQELFVRPQDILHIVFFSLQGKGVSGAAAKAGTYILHTISAVLLLQYVWFGWHWGLGRFPYE